MKITNNSQTGTNQTVGACLPSECAVKPTSTIHTRYAQFVRRAHFLQGYFQTVGACLRAIILSVVMTSFSLPSHATENIPEIPDQLDLKTALEYAMENNFKIQLAKELIEEQEGLIVEIRSESIPRLSMNSYYRKKDEGLIDSGNFNTSDEDWHLSVELRQNVYKGGTVLASLRGQKELQQAALMDLKSIVNDVTYEVKKRYYDVLLSKEKIKVEEQNIRLLEEELQNARDRFDTGAVSQFEVLRAEVLLASAKPDKIRAENQFKIAADQLRHTLGYKNYDRSAETLRKAPKFSDTLKYTVKDYSLKRALLEAVSNRPELKRLQHLVNAKKAGVAISKGLDRPAIDLVGNYAYNKKSDSSSFGESLNGWTVGVEGNWAIFDGFNTQGQERQAKSQLRQSQIQFEDQRLSIEVEVRQAFSSWEEAEQLTQASEKVVTQAKEALRLANARYQAGSATQLDVLQSQVNLTEARNQQLEAYYSNQIAIALLNKTTGTILELSLIHI